MKIEERRSRLLGLDQPTKSAVALITPDVERRVQLVAEIEGHTDSQLADGLFGALTETLRLALREDPERTLDALAKAGLVAGLAESLRLEQRHAHDGR